MATANRHFGAPIRNPFLIFLKAAASRGMRFVFLQTGDPAMNVTTTSLSISAAALAVFMAALVQPALGADAFNGERLAQRWCAACHVVTSAQREANADAPPFEEIAKRPNFSENGLMAFLLNPHAKMPNMNLSRIEAGDIAAYVGKLK
jgi:mono/diheme cytochrome c family protein